MKIIIIINFIIFITFIFNNNYNYSLRTFQTKFPSKSPTNYPTNLPSTIPTKLPTKQPTTTDPTNQPTKLPTKSPSKIPTKLPSISPTISPTINRCKDGFYYFGSEKTCDQVKGKIYDQVPIRFKNLVLSKDDESTQFDDIETKSLKSSLGRTCATTLEYNGKKSKCLNGGKASTYAEALRFCYRNGMRLCTDYELKIGIGLPPVKKCSNNLNHLYWTSTPCNNQIGFRKTQKLVPILDEEIDTCTSEDLNVRNGNPIKILCCAEEFAMEDVHDRPCLKCPKIDKNKYSTFLNTWLTPKENLEACEYKAPKNVPTPKPTEPPLPIERPNLLFVIIDDLKTSAIKGFGMDDIAFTPNIDSLMKKGISFKNAYAQQAICGPSRASFLTGRRPDHVGVTSLRDLLRGKDKNVVTLSQNLKFAGYKSVQAIGKIFDGRNTGGALKQDFPQSFTSSVRNNFNSRNYEKRKRFQNKCGYDDYESGKEPLSQCIIPANDELSDVELDERFSGGRMAKEAEWVLNGELSKELPEQPWALFVGFNRPHLPWIVPEKYWKMYNRTHFLDKVENEIDSTRPKDSWIGAFHDNFEFLSYSGFDKKKKLNPDIETRLRIYHGYYAATTYVDFQLGRIMNAFYKYRSQEEIDNTLIVVLSDHGFNLGDHSIFGKHNVYEQATNTPLIFIPPKNIDKFIVDKNTKKNIVKNIGKISNKIVELVDVYPTIIDFCNTTSFTNTKLLDGKSLIPILADVKNDKVKNFAISQYMAHRNIKKTWSYSLRSENYRFIAHLRFNAIKSKKGAIRIDIVTIYEELYDMVNDYKETINIIDDINYKDVAEEFRRVFYKYRSNRFEEINDIKFNY